MPILHLPTMKPRKSSGGQGNARPAAFRAAASFTTARSGFVEFHPSMSLENAPTLAECLSAPSTSLETKPPILAETESKDTTLESVLADCCNVWAKVNEVIETLAPVKTYQGDVHALRKLQQLHLLYLRQRETHLRTLQIALLQEGRIYPRVEVVTPSDDDDKDIDAPNASLYEWQQEQERHVDFADYDAMDLIELSEQ